MINLRGIQRLVVNDSLEVNAEHLWGGSTSFLSVAGLHKCFKTIRACTNILKGLVANFVSRILILFFMSPVGATLP